MQAEVFLKATKVDGVYTCDPVKHPERAQRYERLSYKQVTHEELQVCWCCGNNSRRLGACATGCLPSSACLTRTHTHTHTPSPPGICPVCVQVMDETAITLCKENNIPVIVFNALQPGNILRAAMGEGVGTVVTHADDNLAAAAAAVAAAPRIRIGDADLSEEA